MKFNFYSNDCVRMQSIYFGQFLSYFGVKIKTIQLLNDALDRSMMSYEEILISIEKLYSSELIFFKTNRIYLTKKYRKLRTNVLKTKGDFEFKIDRI